MKKLSKKRISKKRTMFSKLYKMLLAAIGLAVVVMIFYTVRASVLGVNANNAPTVSTFTVSEDTYISQRSPNKNYGSENVLFIRNKPQDKGFGLLRFVVSGIPEGSVVNSASLNLYVSNGTKVGGSKDTSGYIAKVSGAWSASTVTWKNAPTIGNKIKNLLPRVSALPGQWRNADVSNVVTGNGTYDFFIGSDSASYDDILYASLESTDITSGSSSAKPNLSVTWSPANTSSVTHGPIVGAVTDTSAKVFLRVGTSNQARIEFDTQPNYATGSATSSAWATPLANQDFTVIIPLSNLLPATKYYYWVTIGSQPTNTVNRYEFTTFPSQGSVQDFSFSIFSDAASLDSHAPGYATAASKSPAFVGQIGDFRHEDPGRSPTPITINNWWLMDKKSIGSSFAGIDFANNISNKFAFFHIWDDHDYDNNNKDKTSLYRDSFAKPSFLSYFPTYPLIVGDGGLGHRFRYGKEAEVFVLDLRYQRSLDTDLDDVNKSMLGSQQKAWFKNSLRAAQENGITWKFLVSSSVWNTKSKTEDSWFLYQTEQNELINFIKDNGITNVVVISGDLHTGGAIDDGSGTISCSIGWCIPELSVPHTNLYNQTTCTGSDKSCGTWSVGFLPAKNGVTKISNAGFAHFTVTNTSLLMQVIREDGKINLSYTLPAH